MIMIFVHSQALQAEHYTSKETSECLIYHKTVGH